MQYSLYYLEAIMDFYSINDLTLQKLNSLTKYPSIPTYHKTDGTGMLTTEHEFILDEPTYLISEKIDGTSSRIIFDHEGNYIVGIRENFLWGSKDLIVQDSMGILPEIVKCAEKLKGSLDFSKEKVFCVYGESYGGSISRNSKNYTKDANIRGFRIFDIAECALHMLDTSLTHIANWREHGGQEFYTHENLTNFAKSYSLELVPMLGCHDVKANLSHQEAYALITCMVPETSAGLSADRLNKAEGIVIRTPDRSIIAKLRYQDYERVFKLGNLK
jgi:hypothetical protein